MPPTIIGLYSPAPGSGKSTIAQFLRDEGYHINSFAAPLKNMTVALLESAGYDRNQAWAIVNNKDMVVPGLGFRSRTIQQRLGTEWGRMAMSEDFWVDIWRSNARCHVKVVADDVRFLNEAQAIKAMGGQMWHVIRPSAANKETHSSEGQLNNWDGFDCTIINDGTIEDLADTTLKILGYDVK